MSKEYPVEIYPKPNEPIKDSTERIYDRGYADGQQDQRDLTGWSNLTEAIKAGERIDWDALDGKKICFKHIDGSVVKDILIRDHSWDASDAAAWVLKHHQIALGILFRSCFGEGRDGWSLWVKGELPLSKRTADQLEPGTCFAARHNKGEYTQSYSYAQLVKADGQKPMVVCYSRYLTDIFATIDPKEVEVIDIYGEGTFEKPEVDA